MSNPLKYIDSNGRYLIPASGSFSEADLERLSAIATSSIGNEALDRIISSRMFVLFDTTDASKSVMRELMLLKLQGRDVQAQAGSTSPPRTIITETGTPYYPVINITIWDNIVKRFHPDESGITTTAHELGHAARLIGGATMAQEHARDANGQAAAFGRSVHESVDLALQSFHRERLEKQLEGQFTSIGFKIIGAILK